MALTIAFSYVEKAAQGLTSQPRTPSWPMPPNHGQRSAFITYSPSLVSVSVISMSKKRLASMTTSTVSFIVFTPSCSRRSVPCFSPMRLMASLPIFWPSYPISSAARIISSRITPVPEAAAFHLYQVGPGSPSFMAHRARNSGNFGNPYTFNHFMRDLSLYRLQRPVLYPLRTPDVPRDSFQRASALYFPRKALHLLDVLFGLGLALQPSGGHVAHRAVHLPLLPAPVVLAEDPCDVGVRVWVPSVEEVLVVEVERCREGLPGRCAAFQDLLSPVHPHVVVHVARVTHLVHRRVPVLVVGLGVLELLAGVEVLTLVVFLLLKGFSGPVRQTGELIVVGGVMAKVHRKFAAYDQLFEVRVEVFLRRVGVLDLQRHVYGRDVAVVQILAHVRDVVGLRLVAVLYIGVEPTL